MRPAGRTFWLPGYSPCIFWSPPSARRTCRSIRQNSSRARQITVISAATRLLTCTKMGVTASGPLKSPYLRSTVPWPLCRRKTSLAPACSGVRVVSSAYQPSTAASAWSTSSSKCQDRAGRPVLSVVIAVRRQPETRRVLVITPMRAAIFSAVL